MGELTEYEAQRLANIERNRKLIQNLGIKRENASTSIAARSRPPPSKKQRVEAQPSRVSARLAATSFKPSYNEDALTSRALKEEPLERRNTRRAPSKPKPSTSSITAPAPDPRLDIEEIRKGWTSWKPDAPAPTRDEITGAFHFESHPDFKPNKSPSEVIHEGAFGGTYFRPLYSSYLRTSVVDDWKELPEAWTAGLNVDKYVTSDTYDAEVNKFGVACGQSIEEWEKAGWIRHEFDVRGWFQWYCRFFMGRRCDDDERQVGRWKRCVGERGRWRRVLLKGYLKSGVRTVWDDGEEDLEVEGGGGMGSKVSPVISQTCLHWAWEVRQGVLDDVWRDDL